MPKTKKFFIETEEFVAMVLRFQRGEKTLEDEIYKVFYDKIYGRIFKKIKNHEKANEIMNDVFMKISKKIYTLNTPEAFVSWCDSIVDNSCKKFFQEKKRDEKRKEKATKATAANKIKRKKLDAEGKELLAKFLDSLPQKQAEAMFLHYIEGKKISQIAEELNIAPGTVKSRLYHGRLAFENQIKK